jgi:hypothetical protein
MIFPIRAIPYYNLNINDADTKLAMRFLAVITLNKPILIKFKQLPAPTRLTSLLEKQEPGFPALSTALLLQKTGS